MFYLFDTAIKKWQLPLFYFYYLLFTNCFYDFTFLPVVFTIYFD